MLHTDISQANGHWLRDHLMHILESTSHTISGKNILVQWEAWMEISDQVI